MPRGKRSTNWGTGPRADCPECGKDYSVRHIYNHMRNQHNIWGGKTGIIRGEGKNQKQRRQEKGKEVEFLGHPVTPIEREPEPEVILNNKPETFKEVPGFKILHGSHGGIWLAEQIR